MPRVVFVAVVSPITTAFWHWYFWAVKCWWNYLPVKSLCSCWLKTPPECSEINGVNQWLQQGLGKAPGAWITAKTMNWSKIFPPPLRLNDALCLAVYWQWWNHCSDHGWVNESQVIKTKNPPEKALQLTGTTPGHTSGGCLSHYTGQASLKSVCSEPELS